MKENASLDARIATKPPQETLQSPIQELNGKNNRGQYIGFQKKQSQSFMQQNNTIFQTSLINQIEKQPAVRPQVNSELLQGKKLTLSNNNMVSQLKPFKKYQYNEQENQVKKVYVSNDAVNQNQEKDDTFTFSLKPYQLQEATQKPYQKPPFPQSGSFFLRNHQLKPIEGPPSSLLDLEQQLLKKHFDEYQTKKRDQKSEQYMANYVQSSTPNNFQALDMPTKISGNNLTSSQGQDGDTLKALIGQLEKNRLPKLPQSEQLQNINSEPPSKTNQQSKTLQISSYRYGKDSVSTKSHLSSVKKQKIKDKTKSGQALPSFLIGSSIKSQDNSNLIFLQGTLAEGIAEMEKKKNTNEQKLGNISQYQLSPQLGNKGQKLVENKNSQMKQPRPNAFKKLLELNPTLLEKFPLPFEAKYILESSEPVDVLTIELSDYDYGSLKDPLQSVFGKQIFNLLENSQKSYILAELNAQSIDPINIMSLNIKKEDNDYLKEKYNQLFEQWDEHRANVKVIIKHTEMYTLLKKKYNYHKKHNPELNQFIATRDLSILLFLIYITEEKLVQSPVQILSSINNLIIVINPQIIKKEDEGYVPKKYYVQGMQLSKKIEPQQPSTPTSKKMNSHSLIKDPVSDRKHHTIEEPSRQQFQKTVPHKFLSPYRSRGRQAVIKNSDSVISETNSAKKRTRSPMPRYPSESQLVPVLQQDKQEKEPLIKPPVIQQQESPKKIKILQTNYTHLKSSKINEAFKNYNTFLTLTFKNKERELDHKKIQSLAKVMGINIHTKFQVTDQYFRNRETAFPLKEKLFFYLLNTIRSENGLTIENTPSSNTQNEEGGQPSLNQSYKCQIGLGNNALMVRNIMKQRWWWQQSDKADFKEANFIWTQWRQKKLVNQLKPLKELIQQTSNPIDVGKVDQDSTDTSLSSVSLKLGKSRSKKNIASEIPLEQNYILNKVVIPQNRMYSKLEENFHLSNKKALFYNMKNYYEAIGEDLTNCLPLTFHIKGKDDPEYARFIDNFSKLKKLSQSNENIWIIKPGENTNRGHGIEVSKKLDEIKSIVESFFYQDRTVILQKYIHNPLLINKRKFDIRCYALVAVVNGITKGYFYQEGYLRTSCKEFSLNNLGNRMVHLTNDAIQKHSEDYGKYEAGNKLSYDEFQKYLDANYELLKVNFKKDLLPQIEKLVTDTIRATFMKLDPQKRVNSFEVFGYDFMIDDEFKIYLIEANTNPCLELSSPLLAKLIPRMIDNSFRVAVDPVFLPPDNFSFKKAHISEIAYENKFTLVFDEKVDGPSLIELLKDKNKLMFEIGEEEEEEHQNEDNDNYE